MRAWGSRYHVCIAVAVMAAVLVTGCSPSRPAPPYTVQVRPVISDIHSALSGGQPSKFQDRLENDFRVLEKARPPAHLREYHKQVRVSLTAVLDLANADSSRSPQAASDEEAAAAIVERLLAAKAEVAVLDDWPAATGREAVSSRQLYRMLRHMLLNEEQSLNVDFNQYIAQPGFDTTVATDKLTKIILQTQRHRDAMLAVRPPGAMLPPYVEVLRAFSHDLQANEAYKQALNSTDAATARAKAAAAAKGWIRADELLGSALDRISASVPGAEKLQIRE